MRRQWLPLWLLLVAAVAAAAWGVCAGCRPAARPSAKSRSGSGKIVDWRAGKMAVDCATADKYICGRVESVHDADTIRVRPDSGGHESSTRIRLAEIDAPELNQDFGPEARDALAARLPPGTRVCVVSPGRDMYKRVLGFICTSVGEDLNMWLVASGHAWCYRGRCCPEYKAAQAAARRLRLGLWAAAGGVEEPWEFRRRRRQGGGRRGGHSREL